MNWRRWIGTLVLLLAVAGIAFALAAWKYLAIQDAIAASADHHEPMETITAGRARAYEYRRSATSIGTVLSLRSITLQNEMPGTVHEVMMKPGQIVEQGTVLVALDVSVEQAELKAQEAQAELAEAVLGRMRRASESQAVAEMEVDKATAERDVALAHVARLKAIIERKTIRAPFRARVGLADTHPGQYIDSGTHLTTLQSVEDTPVAHVDFTVAQHIAAGLQVGDSVEVFTGASATPIQADIIAIDARVDQATRNTMIRAKIEAPPTATINDSLPAPGSSVRVRIPVGEPIPAVVIPVNALRMGPGGNHVFVIVQGEDGNDRVEQRQVQSGAMISDEVLIFAGVEPGERVAASGSFKLRDGIRVFIAGDPAPPGSTAPPH
jgi:membrane fusion protein (multidrug efflux system)